jgi:hypothetical protein
MTVAVQQVLDFFERLREAERLEAASEILRRTAQLEFPPLDDETMDRLADEIFVMLDEHEAADAHS